MFKNSIFQFIIFSILLITILSVESDSKFPIGNTTFWWIVQAMILLAFWKASNIYFDPVNKKSMLAINYYLIWNIICIVRGLFIAESYWDWKGLIGNSMAILLPIVAYSASNKFISKELIKNYIKYALPLFLFFAFLIPLGAYGFYLVPISFLILFLPALTMRWKAILIIITLVVFTAELGARSNVIKFGVPLFLSLLYYFRLFLSTKLLGIIRIILFVAPIILFGLAVSNIFNVFNMEEYVEKDYVEIKRNAEGEIIEDVLTTDTRTFLYVEVLQTAQNHNTWWMGRSPARGNESESFGENDLSGRNERLANEVAILNIFTWTGIIGVIFYFIIFYKASDLALNQSNNIFAKSLGLFIAFRWLYSWVEDINIFSLNYFMLWLMIGLCYSKDFREMTNEQVEKWIQSIFNFTYLKSNDSPYSLKRKKNNL